jgi:uncharacterized tellurite resistance protein B-like protein
MILPGVARYSRILASVDPTLDQLDRNGRMRLLQFICSFAWADLEVTPEERRFVENVAARLDLDVEDQAKVEGWLRVPPDAEAVDPMSIPEEQRLLFLESIEGVIVADGVIAPEERESYALLRDLLG